MCTHPRNIFEMRKHNWWLWFLGLNTKSMQRPYHWMQQSGAIHGSTIYIYMQLWKKFYLVSWNKIGVTHSQWIKILSIWLISFDFHCEYPLQLHTTWDCTISSSPPKNLPSQKQKPSFILVKRINPFQYPQPQPAPVTRIEPSDFGNPLKPGQTSSLGVPSFWKIWENRSHGMKRKGQPKHNQ